MREQNSGKTNINWYIPIYINFRIGEKYEYKCKRKCKKYRRI